MPFDEGELQQARELHHAANLVVRARGLMIGETHVNPHPRGLLCNLIQDGIVTSLFLEDVDFVPAEYGFDFPKGETLGHWLRARAAGREDIRQIPAWQEFRAQSSLMWPGDKTNPVKTTRVMEIAVLRGVNIFLVDRNTQVSAGKGKMTGPAETSAEGLKLRDTHMLQEIRAVVPDGTLAGCVLLTGSYHITSGRLNSLNMGSVIPFDAKNP
jgi:hypothetical protein